MVRKRGSERERECLREREGQGAGRGFTWRGKSTCAITSPRIRTRCFPRAYAATTVRPPYGLSKYSRIVVNGLRCTRARLGKRQKVHRQQNQEVDGIRSTLWSNQSTMEVRSTRVSHSASTFSRLRSPSIPSHGRFNTLMILVTLSYRLSDLRFPLRSPPTAFPPSLSHHSSEPVNAGDVS